MIQNKLETYINNPKDIQNNLNLAIEYNSINQTASALSYYERVIKFSDNDDIVYEMLIKCAQCLYRQGNRQYSVRGLYLHAIALIPTRPEAYFFLSDTYQNWCLEIGTGPTGNSLGWQEAYTTAVCGLEYIKNEKNVSGVELLYPGDYGLIFNKAVSAWWIGRIEESKNIFLDLKNNHIMNDTISQAVNDNLNNTNFYDF